MSTDELAEVIARALWDREREDELSKSDYLDEDAVPTWDELGERSQRSKAWEVRSAARAVEGRLRPEMQALRSPAAWTKRQRDHALRCVNVLRNAIDGLPDHNRNDARAALDDIAYVFGFQP